MNEARWARITAVFRAAVEKPNGEERSAWLDEACSGDSELRSSVERLLNAHAEPSLASPAGRLESAALELAPGEQIAQYRVESRLGQGGMGVVYRAFDTRLQRPVALKVLPIFYTASEDQKQRLLWEARAASLLNHPNIVTIYEAGSDQGLDFIAMEYIDGVSLDQCIGEQGMPAAQFVEYARQITAALAAAHGAKVLHRDIKPSNLMVTRDGRVKVLDFGLARLLEQDMEGQSNQTLTGQGFVRGTPAYMSPEQAEGRKLDHRSDIFSLGCVLYQMATGQRPFEGDSNLSVMYKVSNVAAPRPSERLALPPDLDALIVRCLEKDPECRFQTMDELKAALDNLDPATPPKRTNPATGRRLRRFAAIAAAVLALAAAGVAAMRLIRGLETPPRRTVKFAITPANLLRGGLGEVDSEVSISRDGLQIAYVESQGGQLWTRDIASEKAQPVPGAKPVYQAFWSPDNQWIGYSDCGYRPGCNMAKIPVRGGTPQPIVRMEGSFKRAYWSADGKTIVYCDSLGLYTVPAAGGTATRVIAHPHIEHPSLLDLPGGRKAFLYQALDAEQPSHAIYIQVQGESRRRLLQVSQSTNPYPAWSPTGHIVYVDGPNSKPSIWALPFSPATLQATGSAFQVVESGSAPMVSSTGTLVYGDPPSNRLQLAWVDRSGKRVSPIGEPWMQTQPLLSPDDRKVAVVVREPGFDVAVYDAGTGERKQITGDANFKGLGSWAGGELTYTSSTTKQWTIRSKVVASDAPAREWLRSSSGMGQPEWSPDGRILIYNARGAQTQLDLLYRERLANGELGPAHVFLQTPANEMEARFSPDGRYVAYSSDKTGRGEVYVRDFPGGHAEWQVSAGGGAAPRWRRDGRELFYAAGAKLMAVSTTLRPAWKAGTPVELFQKAALGPLQFDVAAGGRRFVVLEKPAIEAPLAVHVVQDWLEEFRTRK